MYVCVCHAVTAQQVRDRTAASCFTFAHYTIKCKHSGCCKCLPRIKEICNEERNKRTHTE